MPRTFDPSPTLKPEPPEITLPSRSCAAMSRVCSQHGHIKTKVSPLASGEYFLC